jgi:glycosyltransferase involved in cell wall biosynthesis
MDSRKPLLTVITPTYNRAEFLDETIESVLSENFPDLQFLVIDDGSIDNTSSVVEKYGSKITYLKHENIGESRTVNKGFRLSRGKFVIVVNSDDPILPGCLARMVGALTARPDCLAAYPDWQIIDSEGNVLKKIRLVEDDIGSMLARGHVSIGPGACFRRVCFELVGYRNPQLKYSADLDYWFRLAVAGNILHVPEVLATHRTHPASASVWAKGRRLADETIYTLHTYCKHPLLNHRGRHLSATAMAHAHFAAIFVCTDWRDSALELARSLLANPTVALRRCDAQPVGIVLEHFERIGTRRNAAYIRDPNRRRDSLAKAKQYFASALVAPDRLSALRPVLRGILQHPVEMLKLAERHGFERLIQQVQALPVWSSPRRAGSEVHAVGTTLGDIETGGDMGEVKKLIELGLFYQGFGDPDRSVAALRRGLDMSRENLPGSVFQALGVSEAHRRNYGQAAESFRKCLTREPQNALASYQLASCLALQGHFAEANAIFSNNIRIACGDGRFTSSIAMRLPIPDRVIDLPFRRNVDVGWGGGVNRNAGLDGLELIYFVSCDMQYLRLFGKAVAESVARNISLKCALHIHVVNPDAEAKDFLLGMRTNLDVPLSFSKEDTDLTHFDDNQRRTYYACARYLVLPDLLTHYELPMLVADIDVLLVKSLRGFFDAARESDVGLMKFPREGYNIMALISASVVFVNRTEPALEFCKALFRYLSDRMQNAAAVTWHLDQAALVAAHLCLPGARYYLIPTEMMLSKVHTENGDVQFPKEVHFWSVTYSIPQNAAKLGGGLFKGFLEPSQERIDLDLPKA